MDNVIEGKLNYLKMVKGEDDKVYLKLRKRYEELQPLSFIDRESEREKINHVFSITVKNFEEKYNCQIEFRGTSKGGVIGHCDLVLQDARGKRKVKRELWLNISKSLQHNIVSKVESVKSGDVIKYANADNLWLNLCRHTGKNYWLITEKELLREKQEKVNKLIDPGLLLELWDKKGLSAAVDAYAIVSKMDDKHEIEEFLKSENKDEKTELVSDVFVSDPELEALFSQLDNDAFRSFINLK